MFAPKNGKEISVLSIPKNSNIQIPFLCPRCDKPILRSPIKMARGVLCRVCSYADRARVKSLKSLERVEKEYDISFIDRKDSKSICRYKKNKCKCEGKQTPDQIDQEGPANCTHTYQPLWSYLETVVREYTNGYTTNFYVLIIDKKRQRRLDCVTDNFLFEIKLNLQAIASQHNRFTENRPIYAKWAKNNKRKFAIIVASDFTYPSIYGRNVYPISKWGALGFSKAFIKRMLSIRKEWLGSSTEAAKQHKDIIEKYVKLTHKNKQVLTGEDLKKHFNMSFAQVDRILGRGKRIGLEEIRKTYNLDYPTVHESMSPSEIVPEYIRLVKKLGRILSESEIKQHMKMARERVYLPLTGSGKSKLSDVIRAVKKITGHTYKHKGRSAGLAAYRVEQKQKNIKRMNQNYYKYKNICKKLGFVLPLSYCSELQISKNEFKTFVTSHMSKNKDFNREISKKFKLPIMPHGQQFVYLFKGSLYAAHGLNSLLGLKNALFLNSIFGTTGRRKTLPTVEVFRNGSKNQIKKEFRGEQVKLIGQLNLVVEKMIKKGKFQKVHI
jgi:hypothetical protein